MVWQQSELGETKRMPAYGDITIPKKKYNQKTNMLQKQSNLHTPRPQLPADLLTSDAGQRAMIGLLSK